MKQYRLKKYQGSAFKISAIDDSTIPTERCVYFIDGEGVRHKVSPYFWREAKVGDYYSPDGISADRPQVFTPDEMNLKIEKIGIM